MLREELLARLDLVAPALSGSDIVPIMRDYWFADGQVCACSDQVAVWTPCDFPAQCAVPAHLADLLRASRAAEIRVETGDNEILVRAARARIRVPTKPQEQFRPFWNSLPLPPTTLVERSGGTAESLRRALERCLRSSTGDTSRPEYLGVVVNTDRDGSLRLYGTDGKTLTVARVANTNDYLMPPVDQVILPSAFVAQAVKLLRAPRAFSMWISPDYVLLATDSATLFGRYVISPMPLDFESIVGEYWSGDYGDLLPAPQTLTLALARASVITSSRLRPTTTRVLIRSGRVGLASVSDHGDLNDEMTWSDHPDVDVTYNPQLLQAGLENYDRLRIGERCCVMGNESEDIACIIASSAS